MSFFAEHANDALFAVATLSGMAAHYAKKSLKGETKVKIHEWFGKVNLNGTIAAFGGAASIIIAALATGIVTPEMAFWPVVYAGLTTGYAVDSSANSDGTTVKESQ